MFSYPSTAAQLFGFKLRECDEQVSCTENKWNCYFLKLMNWFKKTTFDNSKLTLREPKTRTEKTVKK